MLKHMYTKPRQVETSMTNLEGLPRECHWWGIDIMEKIIKFRDEHHKTLLHAKFQIYVTPPWGFFANKYPFLANMWREYFSFNIWTVIYHPELELSDLDQNWARTRPLLFKTFKLWIATVDWLMMMKGNDFNFVRNRKWSADKKHSREMEKR